MIYIEGRDDTNVTDEERKPLPALAERSTGPAQLLPEQHFTEPPPRYSEARW